MYGRGNYNIETHQCERCRKNYLTISQFSVLCDTCAFKPELYFDEQLTMETSFTSEIMFETARVQPETQIQEMAVSMEETVDFFPAFLRELFCRVYDADNCWPIPPEQRHPGGQALMDTLRQAPGWGELEDSCQGSTPVSAAATEQLGREVAEIIRKQKEQNPGQDQDQMIQEVAGKMKEALGQAVGSANNKAKQARKDVGLGRGAFAQPPGDAPGEHKKQDGFDNRLISYLNKDGSFRDILDLVGGLTDEVSAISKGVQVTHCDVTGVEPAGRISGLVNSEMARLCSSKAIKLDLYARLLANRAQCIEVQGEEDGSRGDMVVLVDYSGSMSGSPLRWAKAVAFTLLGKAVSERRRANLITFDHEVIDQVRVDLDRGKMLDALTKDCAGGTCFDNALKAGLEAFDGLRDPDVILITDGACDMSQEWLDKIHEAGGQLLGVQIGGKFGQYGSTAMPDQTWEIPNEVLNDPAKARTMGVSIFKAATDKK